MNENQNSQMNQGPTKLCKHCKTPIPKNAKVCPSCRKKQGGIGKWIAIAAILIIIVSAFSGGDDDSETTVTSKDNSSKNTSTNVSTVDTEQKSKDVSNTADSDADKELKFAVGDTWSNDYMNVTYKECGVYTDYNEYTAPKEGNKIVRATFEFENVGKSDQVAMYTDFNCYADGYSCEGYYYGDDTSFSETLSVGRKCVGTIYFEVPEKSTEIDFEYSVNFWTSENIVFVYSDE